ncbi:MAG TPA: type II toxin-antitoxin system prevent-host-death family antitoxin [Thermoleophilia bacterium]
MTAVGIRELKAHLSRYLRLVQDGESVVVTNRGREIAVIEAPGVERDALRRLMESGMVMWSGGKPEVPGGPPIKIKGGPISQTVTDMREGK